MRTARGIYIIIVADVYTDRRVYIWVYISARKTMTFQFVRAGERRVNPIHKLGLKPVAVGQRGPAVERLPPPVNPHADQAHPPPPPPIPPTGRVVVFI